MGKPRNIEWKDPVKLKNGSVAQQSMGMGGAYHISETGDYGDSRYMLHCQEQLLSCHRYLSDARNAADEHWLSVDPSYWECIYRQLGSVSDTSKESNDE